MRPGDLYAALPGTRTHGAAYSDQAVAAGAVAILTDPDGRDHAARTGVPVFVVSNPRERLGDVSCWIYGDPSHRMTIIGVTGTSGKSTTSYLCEAGLRAAGHTTGLVGGVEIKIGQELVKASLTTPEAPDLQALLAVMAERGVTAAAMEVSSHSLALGRVAGTRYDVALFTNLSQDHLDFHAGFEDYFRAKAKLFTPAYSAVGVVNVADRCGRRLVAEATVPSPLSAPTRAPAPTRRRSGARPTCAAAPTGRPSGSSARAASKRTRPSRCLARSTSPTPSARSWRSSRQAPTWPTPSAAWAPARASLAASSAWCRRPGGRHRAPGGRWPPGRVRRLLAQARRGRGGTHRASPGDKRGTHVVLGCGGDRDRGKRPLMGAAAARLADVAILHQRQPAVRGSARDPRGDAARRARGPAGGGARVIIEPDRAAAIDLTAGLAGKGDVVLVAGKGHETGQYVGATVLPFDDVVVTAQALARHAQGPAGTA